jgi:acetyl-CoA synthetase
MLACARLGIIHSVVFAGFSSEALKDRIIDASSKLVITMDIYRRGNKPIFLKKVVDEALSYTATKSVEHVLVVQREGHSTEHYDMKTSRDLWWHDLVPAQRPYCPVVQLDSEAPLFLLYTSGSTGKPKGLLHTQAGYLLYATLTHRLVFDIREGDRYACVADIGWITGHSYIIYGPLSNGTTTLMFESLPTHPGIFLSIKNVFRRGKILGFSPTSQTDTILHSANCHSSVNETWNGSNQKV